jgi:exodeoxyribonuclease-3
VKIATFNANSIRVRLRVVLDWLKAHRPDVLCLQETKVQDSEFPVDAFRGTGYHVHFRGMKSYNGVAILSRRTPERITFGLRDDEETRYAAASEVVNDGPPAQGIDPALVRSYAQADAARVAHAVIDGVSILTTYVPQGYQIDSPKYAYKLAWFKRLRAYFARHFQTSDEVVWCGDLNVAPREIDVHSPEKHLKHVCFHEDVRMAYAETIAWGFEDVFLKLHPGKAQYTFWDYRKPSSFLAGRGWRIDHILATPPMAERCRRIEVDVEPRGRDQASDHTFLWAEFNR